MPEGDSVRRSAAKLHAALAGRDLTRAELRWGTLGDTVLVGRMVVDVAAYGKHLFTRLAGDGGRPPITIHSHLKMDGRWFVTPTREDERFADHRIRAVLGNKEWTAVGHLLGELDVLPTDQERRVTDRLGPDIMAADFEPTGLATAVASLASRPDRPIGAALLDQKVVAGIGTIFMAESLFRCRIWPWQPAGAADAERVLRTARHLLLQSMEGDADASLGGVRGQGKYVHGRAGQRCRRCGATIRVEQIGPPPVDRPAFFCPRCQAESA